MGTAYTMTRRIVLPESVALAMIGELVPTDDWVMLGKHSSGRRHTVKGIPGKRLDVIVEELSRPNQDGWVLEIGTKEGRFDGAVRVRLCIRRHNPGIQHMDLVPVSWETDGPAVRLVVDGETIFQDIRIQTTLEAYNLQRIVMWHWRRYYQMLPEDRVRQIAATFELEHRGRSDWGLAEANRAASRILYRLARAAGWRKLTLREQGVCGVTGQWHREEDLDRVRPGHRSGCGEETLVEASGARVGYEPDVVVHRKRQRGAE